MEIRSVAHKGLRRLIEDGNAAGLPAAYVGKIEAILSFLSDAPGVEAVQKLTVWRAHQLTGDRKGTWSSDRHPQLAHHLQAQPRRRDRGSGF